MISYRHTWAAVALLAAGCGGAADGLNDGTDGGAAIAIGSGGSAPTIGAGSSGTAGSSGAQNVCGTLGCGPAMKATVPVYYSPMMDLRGSTLEVCRNGVCVRASELITGAMKVPFAHSDGGPLIEAELSRVGSQDYEIQASYSPWDPSDVADGDTYRIQLFDAMGKELGGIEQSVSYTVVHPNGPGCPGECREATIGTPRIADAGTDAPPPAIHCFGNPTCDRIPNGDCQLRPLCEFFPPYYPDPATCGNPGSIYCAVEPGFCIAGGSCGDQLTQASCIASPGCAWWP
jgi:hypothetical protein